MQLRSGLKAGEGDSSSKGEMKPNMNDGTAHVSDGTARLDGQPAQKEEYSYIMLFGRRMNRVVLITHFNIFLYALCFWIQNGTLPYLTKKLGVDPVIYGYLQTTFAVVQLCGGPLFGRFGDLYGGRAALTLAFASAAASYGLLGLATSIPMVFLSRFPSVFMHAMQGGQMVVTDMSDSSQRADALGKLGLSYGVGMVMGSVVGGLVTKHLGEQFAAFAACGGSVASAVLCMALIPKKTKASPVHSDEHKPAGSIFSISKITSLIKQPGALPLLLVRLISGIPIGVFQSMFVVVAMETFKLGPEENGYIMAFIGVISMITQGLGIGFLVSRLSELAILKVAAFVLVWAYLLLAYVGSLAQLYLVLIPLCVGLTLMTTVVSSALTKTVPDADTGAMLGINMAINSMIRSVSPTIGGAMLASLGFPSFGYLGFINSSIVSFFLFVYMKEGKDR